LAEIDPLAQARLDRIDHGQTTVRRGLVQQLIRERGQSGGESFQQQVLSLTAHSEPKSAAHDLIDKCRRSRNSVSDDSDANVGDAVRSTDPVTGS